MHLPRDSVTLLAGPDDGSFPPRLSQIPIRAGTTCPAAAREPGTRTWGGRRAVCGRLLDQRWLSARFLGAGAERGLGEELGWVRRRTRCMITGCAVAERGGSQDRPAEPRYPGAADCFFFAQEPVEEQGGASGTIQEDPVGAGQGLGAAGRLGGSPPLPAPMGGDVPNATRQHRTPKSPQPDGFSHHWVLLGRGGAWRRQPMF